MNNQRCQHREPDILWYYKENMKIVSACLAGRKCRWDGKSAANPEIVALVKKGLALAVCPEELGGLPTPRPRAEQRGKRFFTEHGLDITWQLTLGAKEALRIAKLNKCKEAILKSKSPSCGAGKVYDGTFSGKLVEGDGVFAKMLKEGDIKVVSQD